MKIEGVIIKDPKTNMYFSYVKQFPGVCAQADTIESVGKKIDAYFHAFIEKMSHEKVRMDEGNIETFNLV